MLELGHGKDGKCYYANGYIYKTLSDFGKAYHPLTYYLFSNFKTNILNNNYFVNLTLTPSGYFYQSEPYSKIQYDDFCFYLRDYCKLQSLLLNHGIGITDMGLGLDNLNFMKDQNGDFKWVDYGGIGFAFDARHSIVHTKILPEILAQFEGIECRTTANVLDSRLMMLFFCNQIDAVFSRESGKEIMVSLWKLKLNKLFLQNEFEKYRPACDLTRKIYDLFGSSDWTNKDTWCALEKSVNI